MVKVSPNVDTDCHGSSMHGEAEAAGIADVSPEDENDGQRPHQIFDDMNTLEGWIREMLPVVCSEVLAQDVQTVQTLITQHHAVMLDIAKQRDMFGEVSRLALTLIEQGHLAAAEIGRRRNALVAQWTNLRALAERRQNDLHDIIMQFFLDECRDLMDFIRESPGTEPSCA